MVVNRIRVGGKEIQSFLKRNASLDNHCIQGFILKYLVPPELQELYHDGGMNVNGRTYRFYTWAVSEKRSCILLTVRSGDEEKFLKHARSKGFDVSVDAVEVEPGRKRILYASVSPVFVKKTITVCGQKKTVFPLPGTPFWIQTVKTGIINKVKVFTGRSIKPKDFWLHVENSIKASVSYKDWVFPAYYCLFCLDAPDYVHWTVIQAGIGSRNAQGSGMVYPVGIGIGRKVSAEAGIFGREGLFSESVVGLQ